MKLVCLGNYPPRKCGIATFTENIVNALIDKQAYIDAAIIPDEWKNKKIMLTFGLISRRKGVNYLTFSDDKGLAIVSN